MPSVVLPVGAERFGAFEPSAEMFATLTEAIDPALREHLTHKYRAPARLGEYLAWSAPLDAAEELLEELFGVGPVAARLVRRVYRDARDPRAASLVPTGTAHVRLRRGPGLEGRIDRFGAAAKQLGFEWTVRDDGVVVLTRSPPPGARSLDDPLAALETLAASADGRAIERLEPDFAIEFLSSPPQPFNCGLPPDWHLDDPPQNGAPGYDARVKRAWKRLQDQGLPDRGDPAIVVAALDFGFATHLPAFQRGRAPQSVDFRASAPGAAGVSHGTSVASVALAAPSGNGAQNDPCGVAPGCTPLLMTCGEAFSTEAFRQWVDAAIGHGAAILNCSWRLAPDWWVMSEELHGVIEDAARRGRGGRGLVIVFGSGNDGRNVYDPQGSFRNDLVRHPSVIGVGAARRSGTPASYTNYGKGVVFAPSGADGVGLLACSTAGGGYCGFGGTSGAAPIVSGIAALVLTAKPTLCAACVRDVVKLAVRPLAGSNGIAAPLVAGGLVDAERAVELAMDWSCLH